MVIERPIGTTTTLEEDRKTKGRSLSLWLNEEEDAQLTKDMELLDVGVDAAAVKMLADIGRNTLYNQIGEKHLQYLVSRKRTRFDGRKR